MTGCDLRYEAEQMGARASGRFQGTTDAIMDAYYSTDEMVRTLAEIQAVLASTVLTNLGSKLSALRGTLSQIMEDNRTRQRDTMDDVSTTIEKVRTHFHEAVDQRVSEGEGCDCDEERREAYSEGESEGEGNGKAEMFRAMREAVIRAMDDCED